MKAALRVVNFRRRQPSSMQRLEAALAKLPAAAREQIVIPWMIETCERWATPRNIGKPVITIDGDDRQGA